MGFIDLSMHFFNFVAPALVLALVLPLLGRVLLGKASVTRAWWVQVAINFAAGVAVLLVGLWWWGRDGKMATYAALVLVVASCQWAQGRGWRR